MNYGRKLESDNERRIKILELALHRTPPEFAQCRIELAELRILSEGLLNDLAKGVTPEEWLSPHLPQVMRDFIKAVGWQIPKAEIEKVETTREFIGTDTVH